MILNFCLHFHVLKPQACTTCTVSVVLGLHPRASFMPCRSYPSWTISQTQSDFFFNNGRNITQSVINIFYKLDFLSLFETSKDNPDISGPTFHLYDRHQNQDGDPGQLNTYLTFPKNDNLCMPVTEASCLQAERHQMPRSTKVFSPFLSMPSMPSLCTWLALDSYQVKIKYHRAGLAR